MRTKNVQIHLAEPYRSSAAKATYPNPKRERYELYEEYKERVKANKKARQEFTGPHFKGVESCTVAEGIVRVTVLGAQYAYPLHTTARLKVYEVELPAPAPPADPLDDIPL